MSFRIENKYKVDISRLDRLYKFFNDNSTKILFPKRFIRSIYFDNKFFSSYEQSLEGIVPRKKIRIRDYSKSSLYFNNEFSLETKINSVEGRFKKTIKNVNYLKLLNNGITDSTYGIMYPIIEIIYQREYYMIHKMRITLDSKLKYNIYNRKKSFLSDNEMILEIKSDNTKNFNFIDEKFSFLKTRYSKYCTAVENLKLV